MPPPRAARSLRYIWLPRLASLGSASGRMRRPFVQFQREEDWMSVPDSPGTERSERPQDIERRGFLHRISAIAAAISAVFVGVPVVRAFVSPSLPQPVKDSWIKVAD